MITVFNHEYRLQSKNAVLTHATTEGYTQVDNTQLSEKEQRQHAASTLAAATADGSCYHDVFSKIDKQVIMPGRFDQLLHDKTTPETTEKHTMSKDTNRSIFEAEPTPDTLTYKTVGGAWVSHQDPIRLIPTVCQDTLDYFVDSVLVQPTPHTLLNGTVLTAPLKTNTAIPLMGIVTQDPPLQRGEFTKPNIDEAMICLKRLYIQTSDDVVICIDTPESRSLPTEDIINNEGHREVTFSYVLSALPVGRPAVLTDGTPLVDRGVIALYNFDVTLDVEIDAVLNTITKTILFRTTKLHVNSVKDAAGKEFSLVEPTATARQIMVLFSLARVIGYVLDITCPLKTDLTPCYDAMRNNAMNHQPVLVNDLDANLHNQLGMSLGIAPEIIQSGSNTPEFAAAVCANNELHSNEIKNWCNAERQKIAIRREKRLDAITKAEQKVDKHLSTLAKLIKRIGRLRRQFERDYPESLTPQCVLDATEIVQDTTRVSPRDEMLLGMIEQSLANKKPNEELPIGECLNEPRREDAPFALKCWPWQLHEPEHKPSDEPNGQAEQDVKQTVQNTMQSSHLPSLGADYDGFVDITFKAAMDTEQAELALKTMEERNEQTSKQESLNKTPRRQLSSVDTLLAIQELMDTFSQYDIQWCKLPDGLTEIAIVNRRDHLSDTPPEPQTIKMLLEEIEQELAVNAEYCASDSRFKECLFKLCWLLVNKS